MDSRRIAIVATLAALSIITNYAMISLPNVKLMDIIVFVSGFCFGPVVGILCGIIPWAVYGALNPQGFLFHIWLATMFSETIYGIAGAVVRRFADPSELKEAKHSWIRGGVFFGVLSIFLTFTYDLITNVAWGYVVSSNVMYAVIIGFATFGIPHIISNAFFFGVGCVPAITALLKVVGGDDHVIPKE